MNAGSRAHVLAATALVAIGGGGALACSNDCSLPLARSGCASTFDGQVQASMGPSFTFGCPRAGACGAYRVWTSAPGLGTLVCVYDTSGRRLVSATTCTDYNAYCDNTQSCMSGGVDIDLARSCDVQSLPEQTCEMAAGDAWCRTDGVTG